MREETVYEGMMHSGVSRRDFLKTSALVAASLGMQGLKPPGPNDRPGFDEPYAGVSALVTNALQSGPRVPVIWLEMQGCTGCSEALTRSSSPSLADLVLSDISVEYHETLSTASGGRLEANKRAIMEQYRGKYILVVEGSIPLADNGVHCVIGGRTGLDLLREAAEGAAADVCTGNCASFGGIPRAAPNPTRAEAVWRIVRDKPVVNVPGAPRSPRRSRECSRASSYSGSCPSSIHSSGRDCSTKTRFTTGA